MGTCNRLGALRRTVMVAMLAGLVCAGPASAAGLAGEAREILVPDSSMVLRLWEQVAEDGFVRPHYAVAFDGETFSMPVATSYDILVTYDEFDPAQRTPAVPAFLAAAPDTNVYIVQFHTQPFAAFQRQLAAVGATVNSYMPHNALLVTMSPAVRQQVAAWPHVRWVGPYEPAYRLEPIVFQWLMQPGLEAVRERFSILVHQRGPEQQGALAQRITALGGTVHFTMPDCQRMEATMSLAALAEIVRADEVVYIDRWGGPMESDMNIARHSAGTNANFIETTLGFNGQGVRGEVFDTGVRATHVALPNILFHDQNGGDTSHGTNCYGIVFGTGAGNSNGRGMLPGREQGIFAYAGQVTMFGGWKSRYQHTYELVNPAGPFRAVFQSASVGSATAGPLYTSVSYEVDYYLFWNDLLSCQSFGNSGDQNARPQGWAKNIVTVGGIYHFNNTTRSDDRWNGGGSIGPASDGRVKPDLAAFYDEITCPSDSSDTSYITNFAGTSAATPITCGAFGLMFQMWHNGIWAGHGGGPTVFDSRPHMATAKALMINSAYRYRCSSTDPGVPGTPTFSDLTRYRQGWGMPNLQNLYYQAAKSLVIDETDVLLPLQTKRYLVKVDAGEAELKATMVYTDPGGNPAVQTQHRVNDLTLKVTAPDGTFYYGNYGLDTSSYSTAGGNADTKNTVENVFVRLPAEGTWKVDVIGAEITTDGHPETPSVIDADYGLVVTGALRLPIGDLNCDGAVDFGDINPFVLALTNPSGYAAAFPQCDVSQGDINGDGATNFGDINPFVRLLTNP
ncbi:MAG: S8 family serine peptidase [Planctomycetota bacterium]